MKAKHTHDCNVCKLVAVTELADWYLCTNTAIGEHTLVGRYGSDGPEYWSCPVDIINRDWTMEGSTFMREARNILTKVPNTVEEDIEYLRKFFLDLLTGKTIYGTTAQETFERIAKTITDKK